MIPAGVITVRRDICAACPTPCGLALDLAAPCSRCPLPRKRWGTWGACKDDAAATPPPPAKMRGLGDLIAVVANPIARAIRLDKSKCGCSRRQDALNKAVPFS